MTWRRTSRIRFLRLVATDWMSREMFLRSLQKNRGTLGRSGLCWELEF
jgi:hypothetical protein